jgi:hypothetical protein
MDSERFTGLGAERLLMRAASCRRRAVEAGDIANMQTDPDRRILVLKVAAQWIKMAEQLETLARS